MGYTGGRTALGDLVREVRPPRQRGFEVRFETPAGHQAQVDFAHFNVEFDDAPGQRRSIWLFSIVLGHSRYLWGRFVEHQDLQTVLRCHMEAFEHLGGAPREILYDRMAACSLKLARRAASLASGTYAKSEVINPRRAARARRPQADVTDRHSIRPRRGPLHLVSCELHLGIN